MFEYLFCSDCNIKKIFNPINGSFVDVYEFHLSKRFFFIGHLSCPIVTVPRHLCVCRHFIKINRT